MTRSGPSQNLAGRSRSGQAWRYFAELTAAPRGYLMKMGGGEL